MRRAPFHTPPPPPSLSTTSPIVRVSPTHVCEQLPRLLVPRAAAAGLPGPVTCSCCARGGGASSSLTCASSRPGSIEAKLCAAAEELARLQGEEEARQAALTKADELARGEHEKATRECRQRMAEAEARARATELGLVQAEEQLGVARREREALAEESGQLKKVRGVVIGGEGPGGGGRGARSWGRARSLSCVCATCA